MKELGTDNAIQIIGLLAIAKGELEEIKERKLIQKIQTLLKN